MAINYTEDLQDLIIKEVSKYYIAESDDITSWKERFQLEGGGCLEMDLIDVPVLNGILRRAYLCFEDKAHDRIFVIFVSQGYDLSTYSLLSDLLKLRIYSILNRKEGELEYYGTFEGSTFMEALDDPLFDQRQHDAKKENEHDN